MSNDRYSTSFTTGSFFHRESMKLAMLYLDLDDWNSFRDKVIVENLLQTRMKPTPPAKLEPCIEYEPSRSVKVFFEKVWLADETDMERYLESMREVFLGETRKGKRIHIYGEQKI